MSAFVPARPLAVRGRAFATRAFATRAFATRALATRALFAACAALAFGGCGSSVSLEPISPSQSVRWIGIDSRPLAVGSQLVISFALDGDGGATPYGAASSDSSVISVSDQGGQRLLLEVLSPGAAQLTLETAGSLATLNLRAARPVGVTFSDPSHLAAGLLAQLPSAFALWARGQETIQGVVIDASGNVLNSWGLTQGSGKGTLQATQIQPERYTLAALSTSGSGSFVAGLLGSTATNLTYQVALVESAASAELDKRSDPTTPGAVIALARGLASDKTTEVFGIDDWQFGCVPANACTLTQLSPAAVQVVPAANAAPGSLTLSVTSVTQRVATTLALP